LGKKSPRGGVVQGEAGAVGFIGWRPRVSRQMDGGDLHHTCPRARGAHPAREVGASAMGGAAPCPHDAVMGKMQRERERWGKEGLTGWAPHVSRSGGVLGGKQAARPKGQVGCG
jgi:hypothetical protein